MAAGACPGMRSRLLPLVGLPATALLWLQTQQGDATDHGCAENKGNILEQLAISEHRYAIEPCLQPMQPRGVLGT